MATVDSCRLRQESFFGWVSLRAARAAPKSILSWDSWTVTDHEIVAGMCRTRNLVSTGT
jgi:hypothetical protein